MCAKCFLCGSRKKREDCFVCFKCGSASPKQGACCGKKRVKW